jgi:hypothetical protein
MNNARRRRPSIVGGWSGDLSSSGEASTRSRPYSGRGSVSTLPTVRCAPEQELHSSIVGHPREGTIVHGRQHRPATGRRGVASRPHPLGRVGEQRPALGRAQRRGAGAPSSMVDSLTAHLAMEEPPVAFRWRSTLLPLSHT